MVYPGRPRARPQRRGQASYTPCAAWPPPVPTALLWRWRLAHKLHRNPLRTGASLRWALMGSAQLSKGGARRRLANAAQRRVDCHLSKSVNERGVLHQHPLLRRAFSGQISATSGHCRHSPASETQGNALTRDEHLAWCKRRALEYVDAGDLTHAVASMASDLKTHPDTDNPALNGLAMIGMMYVTDGDRAAVQRWVERFR